MTNLIRQLSTEVANQIAAGEVVEGPGSVIKELVENSVDAGANNITVEVESAGKTKISVSDNGCGVSQDQLPRLLKRHCTSKLSVISDLNTICSMGFRGEALASIASVSRMRVKTRTANDEHGWQLLCEGDSSDQVDIIPCDAPMAVGTSIEVRDLFFRVPARQKNFLESDQTAMRNIKSVMKKMILAHPHVTLILKTPERTLLHAEACNEIEERINRLEVVFGKDFTQSCLMIQQDLPWGKLIGWCAQPYFNRRYTDMQALLLNNRPIRDKKIAFAVKRAYQDVMLPGRHPAFCLYLNVDPELVDVNVHPSKEKVRFAQIEDVTRSIKYAIEQVLRAQMNINTDQVNLADRVRVDRPVGNEVFESSSQGLTRAGHEAVHDARIHKQQAMRSDLAAVATVSEQAVAMPGIHAVHGRQAEASMEVAHRAPQDKPLGSTAVMTQNSNDPCDVPDQPEALANSAVKSSGQTDSQYSLGFALGQLHGLYVLAQNKEGLIIIDMHAAHERILYEKLKASYAAQGVVTQKLLVPYRCHLSEEAKDIINQYGVLLLQMGLELSVDAQGCIMLHSIPAVLAKQNLDALVEDVIQELTEYQTSDHIQSALHKIFASMACHGAIRANRVLSVAEMNTLLRQIEKTASSDYCNHGRPTWFVWDLARIDAVFRRGQ